MKPLREFKTGAEVMANVLRTQAYWRSLKPPPPKVTEVAPLPPSPPLLPQLETEAIERKVAIACRVNCASPQDPEFIGPLLPTPPSIEQIINAVCVYYGVSRTAICGSDRHVQFARPRQVAMYLAKTLTGKSQGMIGSKFGCRDHTTARHSIRRIARLRPVTMELNADLLALELQLDPRLVDHDVEKLAG